MLDGRSSAIPNTSPTSAPSGRLRAPAAFLRERMDTRETRLRRVVVLGDVMTDIVVRVHAPVAVGSDTPAAISLHGGGSGANQAAWLAAPDSRLEVHLGGGVGHDSPGA